ncbi:hypothetical protein ACRRTK_005089 [Alexandromys fortis]
MMDEKPSESERLYSFYDLESNIDKLTEDKKEGLRQLAMTFQHFMREEIQDASQLPPSFDLFEAFAKIESPSRFKRHLFSKMRISPSRKVMFVGHLGLKTKQIIA